MEAVDWVDLIQRRAEVLWVW